MSDPTRRRIVEVLAAGARSVGEVALRVPVSRPAVSQHLKVLHDARLVEVHKDAQRNIYSLNPDGFSTIRDYVDQLWDTALQRYREAAEQQGGRNE